MILSVRSSLIDLKATMGTKIPKIIPRTICKTRSLTCTANKRDLADAETIVWDRYMAIDARPISKSHAHVIYFERIASTEAMAMLMVLQRQNYAKQQCRPKG